MNRDILRQVIVVVSVFATIAVNTLANTLPLNNLQTGEISDRFPIYFVPAGYVFSIWGVIYLGLLAYAFFQALPSQRANARLQDIAAPFLVASAANIVWIFLWHYERFPATLVAMGSLLLSLIVIYLRLGTGRTRASAAERWAVRVPFSIYLGWITVATVANVTQVLYFIRWDGWGIEPEVWAGIMLAVAVILAALMALTRRDVAYLAVLVWAFIGIAVKHASVPVVAGSAWAAAGLVSAFILLVAAGRLRRVFART